MRKKVGQRMKSQEDTKIMCRDAILSCQKSCQKEDDSIPQFVSLLANVFPFYWKFFVFFWFVVFLF